MKKFMLLFLIALLLFSFSTATFADNLAFSEYQSNDAQTLYNFWITYHSQIRPFGPSLEPTDAFLADINNDSAPELVVFFSYVGPGGPSFVVYKNNNGYVILDDRFITSSGTGIHHDLHLILENNGDLKILDHYLSYGPGELAEESVALTRYESGNHVVEQYADVHYYNGVSYSTEVGGENRISCTKQEAENLIRNFYSSLSQNVVFSSEFDHKQSDNFFEIWDMQKQLRNCIKVFLDNEKIEFDQPPIIVDDRTLVPLRAIFEAMGATVDWDEHTKTVTSTKGQTTISMTIEKQEMYKNGELITLDVVPQLVGGRTLVPVRAVAEGFNCKVDWDEENQTVMIKP